MKLIVASMLFIALTGAATVPVSEQQALMVQIESSVKLPVGASSIDQYSRNYALRPDGKVVAVFVIPPEPTWNDSEGIGCDVMLEDFTSRPCTEEEIAESKQQDAATAARFGAADEARWFDDYRELPGFLDGGCSQVEIIFDPRSKQIERAECNGFA
ncbi:hypothetical protein I5E68_19970 [Novosphingobium sp. YJ-S2-02]|uniref:PepSY domain-containing protein n=1 Tax=Novosphingobium aureum TaxID=2792964 RepID=A0A931HH26_9SPHN|nr:hypothetical protein [Novosphingobium aureum]MBH0115214.1 hypothetical protein [Novosphingobium aureum]